MPVYSSDGENLGRVVRVLSAPNLDMFDGVIFDTTAGPGGHRFVDAPEVGEIFERGVVLKIDAAEAAKLPPPGRQPRRARRSIRPISSAAKRGFFGALGTASPARADRAGRSARRQVGCSP